MPGEQDAMALQGGWEPGSCGSGQKEEDSQGVKVFILVCGVHICGNQLPAIGQPYL